MNFKNTISIYFFLLLPFTSWGQGTDSLSQDIPTDILENIAEQVENESGEFDNNTFLEDLEMLSTIKINLNYASIDDLLQTTVLTELQAMSIVNYVKTYGELKSIYELKGIIGLDKETIEKLLPFVYVSSSIKPIYSWKDLLSKGRHTVMYRYQQTLEKAKGYTEPDWYQNRWTSRYAGDRTRQYLRYRYQLLKGISYGVTLEKDPGEKLFQKDLKLRIDYVSAHLFVENRGIFRYIAIGDYEVNLGQGLLMWQGFGVGKSVSVNNVKRTSDVLKPHTSVIEDNFCRGAGASIQKKGFELTSFVSYRMRDGSSLSVDTLTNENLEILSLQSSGLHRTSSEIANRANTKLWTTGGRAGWSGRLFSIYLNATYNKLGTDLTPSKELYKKYSFFGSSLFNASINYQYLGKKFYLFGESAISENGGFAFLNGISSRPTPGVTLSLVHRYYAKNFLSLNGSAFGESSVSNPTNEHGLYAGVSFKIHPKITINNYIDVFYFPWMKYRVDVPGTSGYDIFHEWQYYHNRKLDFYARFRFESKARNILDPLAPITDISYYKKSSFRIQFNYRASDNWTFKTRGEWSFFNDTYNGLKKGYVFYQDIGYKFPSGKVSLSARYAIFNVNDYDARIYTYENDVLYAFSIPAMIGSGSRAYIVSKIRLYRNLDLWIRIAQTFRNDIKVFGSGLEELPRNTRSEVKVQLRYRF
ncbi:MAG: helix-hairpin-helix domain-containing protein [Chitinophagales bacterium]|nr:helix-hairpin-helix domain-containing protein [Chitinophagales bacterium]